MQCIATLNRIDIAIVVVYFVQVLSDYIEAIATVTADHSEIVNQAPANLSSIFVPYFVLRNVTKLTDQVMIKPNLFLAKYSEPFPMHFSRNLLSFNLIVEYQVQWCSDPSDYHI